MSSGIITNRLDAATRVARRAQAELDQAGAVEDIPAAESLVEEAFALLRDAEREAGIPAPDDYFEGLCRCDPAHGPCTTQAAMEPDGIVRPSCTACRDRAAQGQPQTRRMLPTPEGPVPFDEPQPQA